MNKRKLQYYIVDVFAEKKYAGNQLAVFTNAASLSSEEMAAIARETNFSETTFITSVNLDKHEVNTRIFTPGGEVPFAGHPTLGTAYIANAVFFKGELNLIKLNLKVGKIPVQTEGAILWMKQVQPEFGAVMEVSDMAQILGLAESDFITNYPIESVSTGLPFYIAPLKTLDALKKIRLNVEKASVVFSPLATKEVLAFAPEAYTTNDKLACRVFVPLLGIPEDPATGSANGCLAAYLVKHKIMGSSLIDFSVAQGYEIDRPSRLHLKANCKNDIYSIEVGGKVVEIAEGQWY